MNIVHSTGGMHAVPMICVLCIAAVVPNPVAPQVEDTSIPAGYGYILFHIYGLDERSVRYLRMTNVDTGTATTVISPVRRRPGPASWLELLAVPEGRYYWSEVQLGYRNSPIYDLSKPGRSNYVFEVAPDVVNYIGDWFMDGYWAEGRPRVPTTHNLETLKKYIDKFPSHSVAFDVYYSTRDTKPYRYGNLAEINEELVESGQSPDWNGFDRIIADSLLASASNPEHWNVHYRIASRWGSEGGIKIFSDGRTAVCTGESCSEFEYCDDVILGSDATDKITADLVALAEAMPPGSSLTLDDKCEHDREHNVLVEVFGETRLFQYTLLENCRSSNRVPTWMVSLTDKLQGIRERMKPCTDETQIDK